MHDGYEVDCPNLYHTSQGALHQKWGLEAVQAQRKVRGSEAFFNSSSSDNCKPAYSSPQHTRSIVTNPLNGNSAEINTPSIAMSAREKIEPQNNSYVPIKNNIEQLAYNSVERDPKHTSPLGNVTIVTKSPLSGQLEGVVQPNMTLNIFQQMLKSGQNKQAALGGKSIIANALKSLGNKMKNEQRISSRNDKQKTIAAEILTKASHMRLSALNLLQNGDFRKQNTVVVRKTQKGASMEPSARLTAMGENDSPTQTVKNASIAANATANFEAQASSTQPQAFQKHIIGGKALQLQLTKLDTNKHVNMGMYGMSVTPTYRRFIDNSEQTKTPNHMHKDKKPQIDIVVTSYNAATASQKSSLSPITNFQTRNKRFIGPLRTTEHMQKFQLMEKDKTMVKATAGETQYAMHNQQQSQDSSLGRQSKYTALEKTLVGGVDIMIDGVDAVDYLNNPQNIQQNIVQFSMDSTLKKKSDQHINGIDLIPSNNSPVDTEPIVQTQRQPTSTKKNATNQVSLQSEEETTHNYYKPTKQMINTSLQTPTRSSPSAKMRAVSLYARKNVTSLDFLDEQNQLSATYIKDEVPLSNKYANLIKLARREISKDAINDAKHFSRTLKKQYFKRDFKNNLAGVRAKIESPLDSIIESEQRDVFTPPESSKEIKQMQSVEKIRQNQESSIWKIAPNQDKVDTAVERQTMENKMLNKIKKMEMARNMLKMQTVWNHNMKNERLSAQKRKKARAITYVYDENRKLAKNPSVPQNTKNSTLKRTSSLPAHQRFNDVTNEALSQLGTIWGHNNRHKNNKTVKELRNQLHSRNQEDVRQPNRTSCNVLPKFEFLPLIDIRAQNTSTDRSVEESKKALRYAKVPLLSDHVKEYLTKDPSSIDKKLLYRGKHGQQRQSSEQSLKAHQSMVSLASAHASINVLSQANRSRHLGTQLVKTSASMTDFHIKKIAGLISPKQELPMIGPSGSKHMFGLSTPHYPLMSKSSTAALLNFSQQRILKPNFREQQERLKELIRKRNALELSKLQVAAVSEEEQQQKSPLATDHDQELQKSRLSKQIKSHKGMVDAPCEDDCCGYCSSGDNNSIYDEDEENQRLSEQTFTDKMNTENDNTCTSFRKHANRTNHSHLGLASSGRLKNDGGSEADLLRIQTQVLNKRPSPRLTVVTNQIRGFQTPMLYEDEDEIERYSIAVDMRTMQEMHESFTDNMMKEDSPKIPMIPENDCPPSPSGIKRQTHTTLYNQGSLPDYMLASPKRIGKKKESLFSQTVSKSNRGRINEKKNLDLAQIYEKVSRQKRNLKAPYLTARSLFNKPMMNRKGGGITSQVASSNGFNVPIINVLSNPASNENTYADKGDQYPEPEHLKYSHLKNHAQSGSEIEPLPSGFDSDSSILVGVVSPNYDMQNPSNQPQVIECEQLIQITVEKLQSSVNLMRNEVQPKEAAVNKLQPKLSGYFGPGPARSQHSKSSNGTSRSGNSHWHEKESRVSSNMKSILQGNENIVQNFSAEQTPLQRLIENASKQSQPGRQPPPNQQQKIRMYNTQHHSSYDSDEAHLKSMFKSPPRSQIGQMSEVKDNQAKAGVGASNLLQMKVVTVGGGGIISNRALPSPTISFQAKNDSQMQMSPIQSNIPASISPSSYKNPKTSNIGQPEPILVTSILDSNSLHRNTGKNFNFQMQSNNDLGDCLNDTGFGGEPIRSKTKNKNKPRLMGSPSRVEPVLEETKNQTGMRITGQGVQSMAALANDKHPPGEYQAAYYAKLRKQMAIVTDKKEKAKEKERLLVQPKLPAELISSLHICRAQKTDRDATKETGSSVNKKDSLSKKETGKESTQENIILEYHSNLPSPTVKAIRVKRLPSSTSCDSPRAKKLSLVQLNSKTKEEPMLSNIVQYPTQAEFRFGKDVQCGPSLYSSLKPSQTSLLCENQVEKGTIPSSELHEEDQEDEPLCHCNSDILDQYEHIDSQQSLNNLQLYKNGKLAQHHSIMVHMNTSPQGTIIKGKGNTIEILENPLYWEKNQVKFLDKKSPDLTVHGMSIAEMNNSTSGGVHVSTGGSPSKISTLVHLQKLYNNKLQQQKLQVSLADSQPSQNIAEINELLKIHALRKKPEIVSQNSQSVINQENQNLTYQVRTTAKRLKQNITRRITPPQSDLAIDGVAYMDEEDEALSQVQVIGDGSVPAIVNVHDNTGRRTAMAALPPSTMLPYGHLNGLPRVNVKLVPATPFIKSRVDDEPEIIHEQAALQTNITPSMEEPLSRLEISRLEPRSIDMDLNDQDERDKNYSVTQEVQETHQGMIHQINTTNTMQMSNSTIMKIIVTQKKVNASVNQSDEISNYDASPRIMKNSKGSVSGIFGSSVLINGVAMQSLTSKVDLPSALGSTMLQPGRDTHAKRQSRLKQGMLTSKFGSQNKSQSPTGTNQAQTASIKALTIVSQRNHSNQTVSLNMKNLSSRTSRYNNV